MAKEKVRVQVAKYPRLPFHSIHFAQLLSAIVVTAILSYFVWQLSHDSFYVPWTYHLLLAVSALTIISLSVTNISHFFIGLSPRTNIMANSVLLLLWSVGFALFTWWSGNTLTHACSTRNWGNAVGVRICQLFKVLFTFTLIGLVSTFSATYLDLYVFRQSVSRGEYGSLKAPDQAQAIKSELEIHEKELVRTESSNREGLLRERS